MKVGEIMRATADIEALNSALLAMRMTGATESVSTMAFDVRHGALLIYMLKMPTPTQINNGVTAAAFLDAIASMATEIGVFHEPESVCFQFTFQCSPQSCQPHVSHIPLFFSTVQSLLCTCAASASL